MRQPIPSPSPLGEGCTECGVCRTVKYLYSPGGAHHQTPTIPGCVALSNWISVGSGQSVVLLRGRFAQNFNKIFFKIIQIRHNEGKALQKCRFCAVSTSLVVQSLSARCPVVVQSLTGQQLDNNWTTLLVMNAFFGVKIGVLIGIRYMFGFIVRHTPPKRIYVWVYSATHPSATDLCLGSRCDTPRRNGYVFGFIVRHTSPQRICVWIHSATHPGLRPPLSERGWAAASL